MEPIKILACIEFKMLKQPVEAIVLFLAVNVKVRRSKESSTNEYPFHICRDSYLE